MEALILFAVRSGSSGIKRTKVVSVLGELTI